MLMRLACSGLGGLSGFGEFVLDQLFEFLGGHGSEFTAFFDRFELESGVELFRDQDRFLLRFVIHRAGLISLRSLEINNYFEFFNGMAVCYCMGTKPLGAGTRNITINLPAADYIGFAKLASVSGAKMSDYGRALISYAIDNNLRAGKNFAEEAAWLIALESGTRPLPAVRLEIKAGPPEWVEPVGPPKKTADRKVIGYPTAADAGRALGKVAEDPRKMRKKTGT